MGLKTMQEQLSDAQQSARWNADALEVTRQNLRSLELRHADMATRTVEQKARIAALEAENAELKQELSNLLLWMPLQDNTQPPERNDAIERARRLLTPEDESDGRGEKR